MSVDTRRPVRQDTFDLRDQIHAEADGQNLHAHADAAALNYGTDDEHSVLEDDSEIEEEGDMFEEDVSSTLSIPNESIDFDMVYALHSFAATVEGQANVVKGDSLYLMDDSNSYWWLVRVLKTQEVGYIPAENIETPFERLARLNKHRNIELALPTQAEQIEPGIGDRMRNNVQFRAVSITPPPRRTSSTSRTANRRSVHFNSIRFHHRFVPGLKEGEVEDEEDEWDTDGFEEEDLEETNEQMYMHSMDEDEFASMDMDDGMQWDESAGEEIQLNVPSGSMQQTGGAPIPDALMPGSMREYQEQQRLRAQQQEQLQQQEEQLVRQKIQQQQLLQQQQQQQQQQQALAQQAAQAQQQQQQQQTLRTSGSRELLVQDVTAQGPRRIDPAEVTETRKMTVTPTIARESEDGRVGQYLPSIVVEDERAKRMRDDESSLLSDESAKKKVKSKEKMAPPVSSATYNKQQSQQQQQQQQAGKLRKEPSVKSEKTDTDDEGKDKKKKGGVFGGLFGRNKNKPKDKSPSIASVESNELGGRGSSESSRSSQRPSASDGAISPTTSVAQQQQQAISLRNAVADIRAVPALISQAAPSTPERSSTPQVSEHANQLRQRDQQHMELYKEYLNRSPSSPPEAQPSYGLQSASAVMLSSPSSSSALGPPTTRPRPGSLILTSPSSNDIQANLSVIRVFAGEHLQTEATFKTVLLNPSTTATDLVRQAIQRFRMPSGEDENDYYLTVKQVEGGGSTVLQPTEHPLVVFETLLESTELPKVKRSSVGSISSVSSNLSMHPAIKKLSMNDFTDDSAVKFYLNRKGEHNFDDSMLAQEGDDTMTAADRSQTESSEMLQYSGSRTQFLSVSTSGSGVNVAAERFTSPATRFAMQLVIYAEDLPHDMAFHPQTEAIVFKNTLTDSNAPVLVSPNLRRKVFMFPKNVTVAEVTEISLERFGIQDGVIDGGDEVEDKTTKRRSGVRVRYGLMLSIDGQERELSPSSKVIDAFPRPPPFKAPGGQSSVNKRRSLDSAQLLGSIDDVRPDDPVFVLRRSTAYRNSTSRKRFSAPLDEIALQHLHRESTSSYNSEAVAALEDKDKEGGKLKQPSRQEIIAAQRAATRATQKAIVSASSNSVRGMDVLLPGNAVLRSARYDVGDRMRYSYVEPDGETYDVSDIIEEEWREIYSGGNGNNGGNGNGNNNKNDLLEGVFIRNKDGIGEKLDRVLHKIRKGKGRERGGEREYSSLSTVSADSSASGAAGGRRMSALSGTLSASEYSVDDNENPSRSVTPGSAPLGGRMNMERREEEDAGARATPVANANPSVNANPEERDRAASRPGTTTPTGNRASPSPVNANANMGSRRNPSIASIMSVNSGRGTPDRGTPQSTLSRVDEEGKLASSSPRDRGTPSRQQQQKQRRIVIPKDDFGMTQMMAIIEYKASAQAQAQSSASASRKEAPVQNKQAERMHPVDELLFGTPLDLEALHPQVRDIYAAGFKALEEMDKVLDGYIGRSVVGAF